MSALPTEGKKTMDRELAAKRPAEVANNLHGFERAPVRAGALALPRRELLVAPLHQKRQLLTDIHQMARRGEIGHTYRMLQTTRGWEVQVMRIREPRRVPAWTWKAGLGVVVALGVVAAVVWLIQVVVTAVVAVLPVVLGGLAVLALLALIFRGGGDVTVTQIVKIRR